MRLPGGAPGQSGPILARTSGAASQVITVYTLAPDSGGLVILHIGATSDYFGVSAFFVTRSLIKRNGSAEGVQSSYELVSSSIPGDLDGISVSMGNALVAGALTLTVNGDSGKIIDWAVYVQAAIATRT